MKSSLLLALAFANPFVQRDPAAVVSGARLEIVAWDEFEKTLGKRGLAVFESGGWMKIMKK
jgi:hypothetical protein